MKKIFLMLTAFCAAIVAKAEFAEIDYFHYMFTMEDTTLPEGWTMWSDNQTPIAPFDNDFQKGDAYKVIEFSGGQTYLMSNSTNKENRLADVGVATPKIHVPEDGCALLSVEAINYNPSASRVNPLTIMISTTGNSKEDFTDETFVDQFRVPANNSALPMTCIVNLEQYAGKDIYIAFVNNGNRSGYLGLNNFTVSQYYAELTDVTVPFYTSDTNAAIAFNCKLQTPVNCEGFKAKYTTDNGLTGEYETYTQIGTEIKDFKVTIPNTIPLKLGEVVKYTVAVTPNFEGAKSLEFSGDIICAEGYPGICVEEEATGERCTYCPRGAAALAKFSAQFPDRYIAIAVHCGGSLSTKVMENTAYSAPYTNFASKYGFDGLPYAMVNRKANGLISYPQSSERLIQQMIDASSPVKVTIDKVEFDTDTHRVNVTFSPESYVAMNTDKYQAAAVLVADGLKGTVPGEDATQEEISQYVKWAQVNGFNGYNEATIAAQYGESWVPYFKPFLGTGEVLYDMEYNHVGLGIWPDFYGDGAPLPTTWQAQTPQEMSIAFDMPMQAYANGFGVQDWHNTSIVVLILDKTTGEIATAAKMKAAEYTVTSGVDKIMGDTADYTVAREGDSLLVKAEAGASVDVYTIDGFHILSAKMAQDAESFRSNSFRNLMLVKVTKDNKSYFKKLLWNK